MTEDRPVLEQLIIEAALNLTALARLANVDKGTIKRALQGTPIRGDKAQQICTALSTKLGRTVTIKEAEIEVIPLV